ncbi:arylsulfatase B-like [Cimex lectularius]|uniref:Sulfatase N-terminal domain-containing protein n=1 Tax=Cimex lectularius TaxID=79782 RepID=A0A8I6RPP1_CIMLE|nr:arylsulfatase B-like [Cimex lectularius]
MQFNSALAVAISLLFVGVSAKSRGSSPPHVVFIIADDLGWNDVGFHGSDQIPTPNIDALAYNGLILNQHYTPALCTPSRAALLTGKYPIHTGMQHLVILEAEPWGLGLNEHLLPEALAKAGYRSHAIGKWHLGFYRKEYTPTYRGFESHFGYWQGFQDYYNHSVRATFEPYDGYDMRRNLQVDWTAKGRYTTDLLTEEAVNVIENHDTSSPLFLYLAHLAPHTGNMRDPFQAPDNVVAKFSHIKDPERRVYAAMVSKLDESVGEVVAALRAKNMLDNSVIVFMSDNGAPTHGIHSNRGSNYPLRGIKNSAWEGGVRGVAAMWSPLLKKPQRVANQLMYITDWMPTLYSLAGLDTKDLGEIDGYDMWKSLSEDLPSPRNEVLYNIDEEELPYAAIRVRDWKYVTGSPTGERNSGWYGESGDNAGIEYSPQSVLLSKAGMAISAYIIKEQIYYKIHLAASLNSVTDSKPEQKMLDLLQIPTMLDLRGEAELECKLDNITDNTVECRPMESPCLFNLRYDPCERNNLAHKNPHMVRILEEAIERYRKTMIKARNQPSDASADPIFWNNTWTNWQDEIDRQDDLFDINLSEYIPVIFYIAAVIMCLLLVLVLFPRHVLSNKVSPDKRETMSVFTINPPSMTGKM